MGILDLLDDDSPIVWKGRVAALDFETAASQRSSACQIGVVIFEDSVEVDSFSSLIKPPSNVYHKGNIAIHGIKPADTEGACTFPSVWEDARRLIGDAVVVCHNANFDIDVLNQTLEYYNEAPADIISLCTMEMAKDIFPDFDEYSLKALADYYDIDLGNHHDALCDARVCGKLFYELVDEYGFLGEEYDDIISMAKPASEYKSKGKKKAKYVDYAKGVKAKDIVCSCPEKVSEGHPLYGKVVCFTGDLQDTDRVEAWQAVANRGGTPAERVTRKTNILCYGTQDPSVIKDERGISSAHARAIELKENGQDIEIVTWQEFKKLLDL